MTPKFDIPSPANAMALTLQRVRVAVESNSPCEAELIASQLCAAWFVTAPQLQRSRSGMAAHPWGEWPNVRALRDLDDVLDSIEDVDACLVLVRTLRAMYTESLEATELAARLELLLEERGAVAPVWSEQLDAWRFERGHRMESSEGAGIRPPGDTLIMMMEFSHPCGDRCALIVHVDPHNFDHIVSIDLVDDYAFELHEMRQEIERFDLPAAINDADESGLYSSMQRSIKKSYLHEFEPVRFDVASIGMFPLLCHLSEMLR